MFKFFVYAALCLCLIYYSFATIENPQLEVLGPGEYCIYSTERVASKFITKCIDTGVGYIYYCASASADKVRSLFNSIDGESIKLAVKDCGKQLTNILKNLDYHKISESFDGVTKTIYGYSNRAKDFINSGKDRINLQIAQIRDTIIVGWPVILGSY